jgi:hypothetical protein
MFLSSRKQVTFLSSEDFLSPGISNIWTQLLEIRSFNILNIILISINKGTHLIWEELDPARLYIDSTKKLGASLKFVVIEPMILLVRALVLRWSSHWRKSSFYQLGTSQTCLKPSSSHTGRHLTHSYIDQRPRRKRT